MVERGEDWMGREELNHGIQNWLQRKEKTEWTRAGTLGRRVCWQGTLMVSLGTRTCHMI